MVAENVRILIVDDEPIVGKRLKLSLEQSGFKVDVALTGEEAVEMIEPGTYTFVVTDIRMDDIDGIEVLNHVKKVSPSTKVIIITGYATIELAREAIARGAMEFIAKPFNPSTLYDVICHGLRSKESTPSS